MRRVSRFGLRSVPEAGRSFRLSGLFSSRPSYRRSHLAISILRPCGGSQLLYRVENHSHRFQPFLRFAAGG